MHKAPHALTGVVREKEKAREEVRELARREEEWVREDGRVHDGERERVVERPGVGVREVLDEKAVYQPVGERP